MIFLLKVMCVQDQYSILGGDIILVQTTISRGAMVKAESKEQCLHEEEKVSYAAEFH